MFDSEEKWRKTAELRKEHATGELVIVPPVRVLSLFLFLFRRE